MEEAKQPEKAKEKEKPKFKAMLTNGQEIFEGKFTVRRIIGLGSFG